MDSFGYIYKTTNLINGRVYIGQKKGQFKPSYLGSGLLITKAINKYGRDSFKVEVITTAENRDKINELEMKFIAEYKKLFSDRLYNITAGGLGTRRPYPEEAKLKNRLAHLGKIQSIEARLKMSIARKGIPKTEEHKAKIALAHLGKKRSPMSLEQRLKLRKSNVGLCRSEETCRKISEARIGKKFPRSKVRF